MRAPKSIARLSLILLLSINLMNYVDRQVLSAVEKPIGDQYGVGTDVTGKLPMAFLLSYMVFSPLFGFMADRTRRWAIIGVGVIVWSLASGGSGAVTSLGMLFVMRILIGTGEAAYGPIAPTVIADLYPIEVRGKVLAWFYAAIPVGSAIGYIVGGQFHAHWRWAFYVTLPPGMLLGALCFFMPEPKRDSATAQHQASMADYRRLVRIPSYLLNTVAMAAMTFALGGIGYFMPRFLQEAGGLDPERAVPTFGIIACFGGLAATLAGGIAGDKLRKRFPSSYFLVSSAGMLVGFPLTLLMLVTPFPLCWVVISAAIFCLFLNTGPSNTALANTTPAPIRATAFALNIFVIHLLGDAISPAIIGWIAARWGIRSGFALVSMMILVGGCVWLWAARYLENDTKRASGVVA